MIGAGALSDTVSEVQPLYKELGMTAATEITAGQVAALLAAAGHDMGEEQILAIREFVQAVGSFAKAQEAIEALSELERAA